MDHCVAGCRHTPRSGPTGLRRVAAQACGLVLASSATAVLANDGVHAFSARYEGRKKVALITATVRAVIELKRSSQFVLYTMRSTVTWALLERRFHDCSVMRIDGSMLRPLEYRHLDESQPGLDVHTRFDWDANVATTTLGASTQGSDAALTGSTWDPMSFQVALSSRAQRRVSGDTEVHRVIERGVVKEHRVSFGGLAPVASLQPETLAYGIVSRKDRGAVVLHLLPEHAWRPLRVGLDEVTIDLVGSPAGEAPGRLPDGEIPRCPPPTGTVTADSR